MSKQIEIKAMCYKPKTEVWIVEKVSRKFIAVPAAVLSCYIDVGWDGSITVRYRLISEESGLIDRFADDVFESKQEAEKQIDEIVRQKPAIKHGAVSSRLARNRRLLVRGDTQIIRK